MSDLRPDCFDCGWSLHKAGLLNDKQGWVCDKCGATFVIDRVGDPPKPGVSA